MAGGGAVEDKTFELLTKIYSEFTSRFDKIETDMQGLRNDMLRIEQEHGSKLEALFDGYKRTYEKLDVIEQKLDNLAEKVDRNDIKIQVMEGGRK